MPQLIWFINTFGLLISVTGSIMAFFGSPKDTTGHGMWGGAEIPEEQRKLALRQQLSKSGFALLMIGFVFQFIAQCFQYPK